MSDTPKKAGWSRGFLWGCLTPIIAVGVIVIALAGYAGYYAFFAYKSDRGYQVAMASVQSSATARQILGDGIALSGFPGYSYSYSTETGHTASYHFTVKGTKAEGTVQAELVYHGEEPVLRSLVLTAPDGLKYDLITNKQGNLIRAGRFGAWRPAAAFAI